MDSYLDINNNYFGVRHYKVHVTKEKIKPLRFITSVISYAIFIWLLLVGLMLLAYVADIKIRAAKGDTSPPIYNAYVVLTGSMIPEIMPKDVVVTKKREAKDLEVGDIITFLSSDPRLSNIIVTHRIKAKYYDATTNKYTFQTKGDANNTADFTLAEDTNIIGEVIFKIPKIGYIQSILATKGGLIIVVLIPCLAVLSYDIVKLGKNVKKKVSKKKGIHYVNYKSSDTHTHMLRHTFATRCIESGIAIEVLQKILGHADITTTINTYGYIYSYLRQKELNQKYTKYMQDTNTILEENFERFEEEYLKLK